MPTATKTNPPAANEQTPRRRRGRPTREESENNKMRELQADFLVGCSLEERASAVRFIRLIRTNYWLSNFAKQILELDAENPFLVTIEKVQAQLDKTAVIEDLVGRVQFIGRNQKNWFINSPAVRAVIDEWGDEIFQYKSDKDIRNLIESSRTPAVRK